MVLVPWAIWPSQIKSFGLGVLFSTWAALSFTWIMDRETVFVLSLRDANLKPEGSGLLLCWSKESLNTCTHHIELFDLEKASQSPSFKKIPSRWFLIPASPDQQVSPSCPVDNASTCHSIFKAFCESSEGQCQSSGKFHVTF